MPYDVVLWTCFRGDEAALRSMKESNLIAVNPRRGAELRYDVEAGSPLYQEVFRRLVRNEGLAAVLDLEVAKEDVAREQKTIEGYEHELVRLEEILDARRDWWFSSRPGCISCPLWCLESIGCIRSAKCYLSIPKKSVANQKTVVKAMFSLEFWRNT